MMGKVKMMAVLGVLVMCGPAWADLTDGLVAHWEFDEGSGDIAYDSAGSNDGTIYGAQWTTGQINGALDFNGNDVHVRIPDDDSISIGNQDYTISAWINPRSLTGTSGWEAIVSKVKNSADKEYALQIVDGVLFLGVEKNENNPVAKTTVAPVEIGYWQHVVVTFNSDTTTPTFYYNGVVQTSTSNINTLPDELGDDLYIGMNGGTYYKDEFNGKIDDVRIYDRALSADEVEELYHGQLLSLEVVGPDEVAENFQAQYKAIADYELASDVDVTDSADWSVEPNSNCNIAAGLLTTEMVDLPMDITITAQYSEGENTQEARKDVSIFTICPSGSALDFDGVGDYVDVPDSPSLDISGDEITITAWINVNTIDGRHVIAAKTANGDNTWLVEINPYTCGDGKLYFYLNAGNTEGALCSNGSTSADKWCHVAFAYDGNDKAIYIDGQFDSSNADSGNIPTNGQPVRIGNWSGTPARYFNGLIDEVRVYDRALSAGEIQANMHTKPDTTEPNLVAYWDFDEGSGQEAGDSAGGNNGTIVGAGWVDSVPPVGICTLDGLVERNLSDILNRKLGILSELGIVLGKEDALLDYMDGAFHNGQLDNLNKGDVVKAKQKIHSAIQQEEQAETAVDQSIEKLDDALNTLGIE